MRTILLALLLVIIATSSVLAVDVAPRISDREIIEKLATLQEEQKAIRQEIRDFKESTNKRFDDMNKRFDTLQWMLGVFVTIALAMMGLILKMLWDQAQRMTVTETTLETQKDEIAFFKNLIEKLLPPRGVL